MKNFIPWFIIVVLGIIIGILISDGLENEDNFKTIEIENKKQLQIIKQKDSLILINSKKLDSINNEYTRLINSINKMKSEYPQVTKKYEKLYINPDSINWNKLDSSLSVILNR